MKHFLILMLFLIWGINGIAQSIVINEIQAGNITTFPVWSYSYDWIELKNTTPSDINLYGWYISDDPENPYKYQITKNKTIAAGSYLIIFANGDKYSPSGGYVYSNFELSLSGEVITLFSADSTEVDRVEYPGMMYDISYGRLNDGTYSYMNPPSPNAANTQSAAFTYLQSELSCSVPSGLYDSAINIELSKTGEGDIYYTLDGTIPTLSSNLYTGTITIDTSSTLKAIVIKSENEYSLIENRSYIIGASHSLPVVLLTSDNAYFNSRNKQVIDGRVEFSFIEEDGTLALNQYVNFKATGNTSGFLPQLNGKVKANKIYGRGNFDYKMFPNKDIDKYESFLLRNASQDWACTYLIDGFVSNILGQDNLLDIAFEGYRPAILYVNGKYHGIINIREDDDNDFVKSNWVLDNDEFTKNSYPGPSFYTLDFSKEYDRETFDREIDLYEYVTLNFLSKYTADMDYRTVYWHDLSGKTDHEYHYFFHDFDTGFGKSFDHANYLEIMTSPVSFDYMIYKNIAEYAPYRNKAVQIIAAQVNHIYKTERTLEILEQTKSKIKDEIPAHAIRMNELANESTIGLKEYEIPYADINEWENNIADLRTNVSTRIDENFFERLAETYGLEETVAITYATSDSSQGIIKVENVISPYSSFTGTYFSNIPVSFSAEPLPGFQFVRWEGDTVSTDSEIAPVFSSDASITAVFKAIEVPTGQPVINEIQGKNDTTIADENGEFNDWIEIYNPTNTAIDMSGYYLSDNPEVPLKWQIPATDSLKTTVEAKGFLLLWADKDTTQGATHMNFKLKASDQVILTHPDGQSTLQYIEYSDVETDLSYAAKTDGSSTFVITDKPTPNATNEISEIETFIVIFNDWDGTELKKDTVEYRKAAIAPEPPTRSGYVFLGWDNDFSNIISDTTVTAQYTIIDAVEAISKTPNMKVYPSPASNSITISPPTDDREMNTEIMILNLGGNIVFQNKGTGKQTIDISNLPGGIYFVRTGTQVTKFIKM